MRFVLSIDLGNDAMQYYNDIREAIHDRLRLTHLEAATRNPRKPSVGDGAKVMDLNGNTVGKWEVIDQPAKPQAERPTLDSRELATVLHGLRMIQCEGRIEGCAAGDCEHFTDAMQLTNWEIDDLCERLNV